MNQRKCIMIVEDDKDDLYLMEEIFADLGFDGQVLWFPNGAVAYDYLRRSDSRPMVILSDINMPIVSGIEFRTKIIQDASVFAKGIPFIFFTTSSNPNKLREAYSKQIQG